MKLTEYDLKAQSFLAKAEAKMSIIFVCHVKGFPFDNNDKMMHSKYQVVITRNGKQYDFPFYGSHKDYLDGRKPSKYSILACLEKYEQPDNLWEFAREYGYEINSEETYNRVNRIWQDCRDQYNALLDLFGDELMEELEAIQ